MMDDRFAVWATMRALPGKEAAARAFLAEACERLKSEAGTTSFRAIDLGDGQFAIFNSFLNEDALMAHVNGDTAKWVMAQQPLLFDAPYAITKGAIFAQMHKRNAR